MADYYSILKKTIASLPENNGAARRNVYSRARNAIVNQLKAYEPPLSPSEITAEQLRLEESIRKVEAEAARETLMASRPAAPVAADAPQTAAPVSAPATPRPSDTSPAASTARTPLGATVQEAERLGQASARAVQTARDAFAPDPVAPAPAEPVQRREPSFGAEPVAPGPGNGQAGAAGMGAPRASSAASYDALSPAASRPAEPRRDRRIEPDFVPEPVSTAPHADRKPPRARNMERGGGVPVTRYALLGGLVLIIIGLAAVLFGQRDLIASLFSGSDAPAVAISPADPAGSTAPAASAPAENGKVEKTNDRLLTDSGEPAVAPDARTVTTTLITPSQQPAVAEQVPAVPAVETPVAVAPITPPAPVAEVPVESIVAQRSILYEEGEDASGSGTASQGRVAWSVIEETDSSGKAVQVLAAQAEIPDRNIAVSVRIKPNTDASLPASHLVEIQYQLPDGFTGKDVANVPGLVMKPTEEARGDALMGASVKVAPGFFWIALSSIDNERDRNLALLRERGWIDIPMLYETGKRAILTLEKGTPGARALEQAMASWTKG
ncbi:hypothetical protein [Pannonibacter carbonis]|uniref:hypothetical protein n=1 Tax=Pannonibacter carbonis TaxID=2067569 RepID=UPI000D108ADD|nr:hypothetical protein [Pannonibacter carbonis]